MDERRLNQDCRTVELKRCSSCGRQWLLESGRDPERTARRRDWRLWKEFHPSDSVSTQQPDGIGFSPRAAVGLPNLESSPGSGRRLVQKAGELGHQLRKSQ